MHETLPVENIGFDGASWTLPASLRPQDLEWLDAFSRSDEPTRTWWLLRDEALLECRLCRDGATVRGWVVTHDALPTVLRALLHELSSPLTVLGAALELLDGDPELLGKARAAFGRLSSTLCAAKQAFPFGLLTSTDPFDAVAASIDVAAATVPLDRSGDVTVDVPSAPLVVHAPRPAFEHVLTNLLTNALVHGIAPVTIRVWATDDMLRVEVADAGVTELGEWIFDVGRRSDRSPGSGVGLALSRLLVEAMHGTLSIESGPAGTVASVTVPLHPSAA